MAKRLNSKSSAAPRACRRRTSSRCNHFDWKKFRAVRHKRSALFLFLFGFVLALVAAAVCGGRLCSCFVLALVISPAFLSLRQHPIFDNKQPQPPCPHPRTHSKSPTQT